MQSPKKLKKLGGVGSIRRQAVRVSAGDLVRIGRLQDAGNLPALCTPSVDGVDLVEWAGGQRERIEALLTDHGAVLFRGFDLRAAADFERLIGVVSGESLEYRERSTPRSQVHNNIYTSTDYPADQSIFLHNENSYQHTFPLRLFFFCDVAPGQGGETPIADCRRVAARIAPEIRERFARKQIMYVRNFGNGMGLSWQSVFQTEDRTEVESYCRKVDMQAEWRDGGRLRVRRVLPAVARHPKTGEEIWFNHATFFHVSTLHPSVRDTLLETFAEEDLPNNTYYGDGTPIEPTVLETLRVAYATEKVVFPWQRGDVLMLDNILTAHAREPYAGDRRILTGMSEPCTRDG